MPKGGLELAQPPSKCATVNLSYSHGRDKYDVQWVPVLVYSNNAKKLKDTSP